MRRMRAKIEHKWDLSPEEAIELQKELAKLVRRENELPPKPRLIAGVDISRPDERGVARGAIVVIRYPDFSVEEVSVAEREVEFPYIPGLLSFRETPLLLAAAEKLSSTPDLVLVDGQGIAHPRRFGIASHLGVLWDIPTVGCAKSPLCGRYELPGPEPGDHTELVDGGEVIGAVLRTKRGTNPVFVSVGHKIDLPSAVKWVLRCCRGFRIPEPIRLAHLVAGGREIRRIER